MHQRQYYIMGFTLIELMIAVAIVAVLAAIAYPSYTDSIRKARRAEAKSALLENGQFMERIHTESNRYDKDANENDVNTTRLLRQQTPIDGGGAVFYNITLSSVAANTYTLLATAINDQTEDKCGNLSITQAEVKACSKIANTNECISQCWR